MSGTKEEPGSLLMYLYFDAIYWIAHNDEPDEMDAKTVEGFLTTLLVADVFATKPETVAADIITERRTCSE